MVKIVEADEKATLNTQLDADVGGAVILVNKFTPISRKIIVQDFTLEEIGVRRTVKMAVECKYISPC